MTEDVRRLITEAADLLEKAMIQAGDDKTASIGQSSVVTELYEVVSGVGSRIETDGETQLSNLARSLGDVRSDW